MRRKCIWLIGLIPVLAACGGGGGTTSTASHQGQTFQDSAGWSIKVPSGWRTIRFSDSNHGITSAGVQLSNVRLPPPSLVPGFPIQVSNLKLPAHGVGLIIATDIDPRLSHATVAAPPLPVLNGRYWMVGSALGGNPYIETLWFRADGMTFIASAKIGPKASGADLRAVSTVIRSLH